MRIGLIGLGKMGGNMRTRLRNAGIEVVGYDHHPELSDAKDVGDLVAQLPAPRIVWSMLPAGKITQDTIDQLADLLGSGDLIIEGGNSRWSDDVLHADQLAPKGIGYLDAGVSGGVWGLENGYALMVGGAAEDVAKAQPVFDALKPPGEFGFAHAGKVGAGHYAKMVHNGIEYGLMQAYAEGWELLTATDVVTDVPAVVKSWQKGTVIRSWLLDLMVNALEADADLSQLRGFAQDSGEGRWTVQAAVDHAVPLPVITAALYARFASRQDDSPAMKVVAALRNQFGGHPVTAAAGSEQVGADSPGADARAPSDGGNEPADSSRLGTAGSPPDA